MKTDTCQHCRQPVELRSAVAGRPVETWVHAATGWVPCDLVATPAAISAMAAHAEQMRDRLTRRVGVVCPELAAERRARDAYEAWLRGDHAST